MLLIGWEIFYITSIWNYTSVNRSKANLALIWYLVILTGLRSHTLWLSDHDTAQFLDIKCTENIHVPTTIYKFKCLYSDENIQKFKNYLQRLTFLDVFNDKNANLAFSEIHVIITLEILFPSSNVKIFMKSNSTTRTLAKNA